DKLVTGVQTCALPISDQLAKAFGCARRPTRHYLDHQRALGRLEPHPVRLEGEHGGQNRQDHSVLTAQSKWIARLGACAWRFWGEIGRASCRGRGQVGG